MRTLGQSGIWDEQQKDAKLQDKKTVLKRLSDSMSWESFRPLLGRAYTQDRRSNAGRKRIDHMIAYKMVILQQHFNIRDEELEFQANDRRSFEEIVSLRVMNNNPNATRNRLLHREPPKG